MLLAQAERKRMIADQLAAAIADRRGTGDAYFTTFSGDFVSVFCVNESDCEINCLCATNRPILIHLSTRMNWTRR